MKRLTSTLLALALIAGCATGSGLTLEHMATINSTLFFKAQYDLLEDSELANTEIKRVLIAVAATDIYVQKRYPTLATGYLDLVGAATGAYTTEIDEILEMVRLSGALD